MPARPQGVYQDKRGKWYFKVTVGHDPLTGKRDQITRRGFATMAEAARERREVLGKVDRGQFVPSSAGFKVDELLDLYLDGIDADKNLALKTRFDYRQYAADYIRPYIGDRRVRVLLGQKDTAAALIGVGEFWVEPDRLGVIGDGAVEVGFDLTHQTAIVVGAEIIWIDANCVAEVGHSLIQVPGGAVRSAAPV